MDEDFFEDTISVIHYSDSQKSIDTTNAYSPERADGSSGRSRRTYVVAVDSDADGSGRDHRRGDRTGHTYSDADDGSDCSGRHRSEPSWRYSPPRHHPALVHDVCYALSIKPPDIQIQNLTLAEGVAEASDGHTQCTTDSLYACSLVSHEIFTQTSKTIFELAQIDHMKCMNIDTHAIETQTSRLSVVENKITEYRLEVSGAPAQTRPSRREPREERPAPAPGERRRRARPAGGGSSHSLDRVSTETLRIINEETKSQRGSEEQLDLSDDTSENDNSLKYDTDFTDSLEDEHATAEGGDGPDDGSDSSVPQSVDRDVAELYSKLEASCDLRALGRPEAFAVARHVALSPLTEETVISWKDNTKTESNENCYKKYIKKPELREARDENRERLKLPPIQMIQKALSPRTRSPRRSQGGAASSSADSLARERATNTGSTPGRLPNIRGFPPSPLRAAAGGGDHAPPLTISITGNIRRLKQSVARQRTHYSYTTTESRSSSPGSGGGGGGAGADVAARGADALAGDVLARLRQATSGGGGGGGTPLEAHAHASAARYGGSDGCGAKWAEAVGVLEEVPALFQGFWGAVPEHRVADLIRLVTAQVESPRTRVATAACAALAAVLENTGYTKKPEFVEAVSTLLVKTGSCVAPVRRAANVALDGVVAGAPPAAAVAALCGAGLQCAQERGGALRQRAAAGGGVRAGARRARAAARAPALHRRRAPPRAGRALRAAAGQEPGHQAIRGAAVRDAAPAGGVRGVLPRRRGHAHRLSPDEEVRRPGRGRPVPARLAPVTPPPRRRPRSSAHRCPPSPH